MLPQAVLKARPAPRSPKRPPSSNAVIASLARDLAGALVREPSSAEWQQVLRALDSYNVQEIERLILGDPFALSQLWATQHVNALGNSYAHAANEELRRLGSHTRLELYQKAARGGSRRRPQKPEQDPPKIPNRFPGVPHEDTFIRRQAGKLITRVSGEQRAAIREMLAARYNREKRPETLVRDLRRSIGLDAPRARALRNFEDAQRANGAKNVDAKVERYKQQLIASRAQTIARTESVAIENQGRIQAWEAAIDAGDLPIESEQEWTSTGEPCPDCQAMDGQRVPVGEDFTSLRYGLVAQPPLHPNCYCILVVRAFKP